MAAAATSTPTASSTLGPTPTPSPSPALWQTYVSKPNRYRVSIPPGWFSRPGDKDTLDEFDSLGYVRVFVGRQTYDFTIDVADFARQDIARLKKNLKAKLISNNPIRLANGYLGRIFEVTYDDHGTPVAASRIILAKDKIEYDINMYVDYPETSSGRELFPQIYESWRPTR